MESWPTAIFVGIPAAGAVIFITVKLVSMFLKSEEKWSDELKQIVGSSNTVIERNTDALIEITGVIQRCKAKDND